MKAKIFATAIAYLTFFGMIIFISTPFVSTEVNYQSTWISDVSERNIIVDGSISDWGNTTYSEFGTLDIYIGYDDENIYVAVRWIDVFSDNIVSHWNKTGMINSTTASWELVDGNDDSLSVGFALGEDSDVWTWTASDRTSSNYAYESDASGVAD